MARQWPEDVVAITSYQGKDENGSEHFVVVREVRVRMGMHGVVAMEGRHNHKKRAEAERQVLI
jgi:hypothetical protein